MTHQSRPRGWRRSIAACLLAATAVLAAAATPAGAGADGDRRGGGHGGDDQRRPAFTLTILHNNDGESSLLPTVGDDGVVYGGIARFDAKVQQLRRSALRDRDKGEASKRGVVLFNSGDNYLPGTTLQASQQEGAPFYDGVAVRLLDYDALGVGNHEFDFGPASFARFVETVGRGTPFVSANLDYSGEPTLAPLTRRSLVASAVVRERGERIGVVGLTTPSLPTISSPGGVVVRTELASIAQAEIDALTARGVNKIVLMTHLQGLDSEIALAAELRDVDVIIGGGGDEILADADDELFPGHADDIVGSYPQVATDLDGEPVPVVTTPGNYRYVGALQVTFDRDGEVLAWDEDDSGIKLVTDTGPEAVGETRAQKRRVEEPVAAFVADLAATIIGRSEVNLDCERPEVRGAESNCGNLLADGLLASAQARAADFGVDTPQVAIQNGGGIRGEVDQPVGPITVADTFRLAPFGNFVAVAEDVPAETLRQIIEEGAIALPATGDGGFVHLAGATVVIDPSFPARDADQNTGVQNAPGQRVRSLVLDDGTVLVDNGVAADVTVDVAGLNFSLGGGDAYPAVPFVNLGVTDQQALRDYIEGPLGGVVTAAAYPPGGEGRITILG
ncbi:MAG: bifunctional metallophosphatase/5'-nucleotidase [Acidimicrobiales bacterium]